MPRTEAQLVVERLQNEYEDLMQLSESSKVIKIRNLNGGPAYPPTQYEITYLCPGYLNSRREIHRRWVVKMSLPEGYPRELPRFDHENPRSSFHPHVWGTWICIGHDSEMPVGLRLRRYVLGVAEMILWRKGGEGKGGPIPFDIPLEGDNPQESKDEPKVSGVRVIGNPSSVGVRVISNPAPDMGKENNDKPMPSSLVRVKK